MTVVLVIDVGTSSIRAALVDERLEIAAMARRPFPPSTPFPGLVELDARELVRLVLDATTEVLAAADGPVTAVGITNQRASTIVWDRATGEPVTAGLGWQDLRTIGECMAARAEHDLTLAPNQSATKLAWILANVGGAGDRDLCFGTVDTWLVWSLTGGSLHVTDHTNAGVTGLVTPSATAWSERTLDSSGSQRPSCRRSSTPAASSARHRRSPAARRSPPSSATSRRRSWARAA